MTSRPMRERLSGLTVLAASALLMGLGPDPLHHAGQATAADQRASAAPATATAATSAQLRPTAHPPLPGKADFWFVPASTTSAALSPMMKAFADGIDSIQDQDFTIGLRKVTDPRLLKSPVSDYAIYYTALAQLRTGKDDQARAAFKRLNAGAPEGVLKEWALLGEAQAAESQNDFAAAARLYEAASALKTSAPDEVLTAVGRTKLASNQRDAALAAFRKVYFEYPLSPLAETSRQQILAIMGIDEATRVRQDLPAEFKRGERLFSSKRYAEALSTFQALSGLVSGDDKEVAQLRIAECQYFLGRYRDAIEGTKPFLSRAARTAEARFFYLSALRGAGDHNGYVDEARKLAHDEPASPWTEEALNNLGTHYILTDDDEAAEDVFREYLEKFPAGKYAQRASWKFGWTRYRKKDYQTVITVFERAAANFPRSDYRPPWLYWSARAYDQLNQTAAANIRYSLVVVDYLNSYYGRLADEQLKKRGLAKAERVALITRSLAAPATPATASSPSAVTPAATDGVAASSDTPSEIGQPSNAGGTNSTALENPPAAASAAASAASAASAAPAPTPTDDRIRKLITAGLYRTAVAEVDFARRNWGTSPALEATAAWLYKQLGDYRRGINAMKRAYPQYLTSDGEQLPKQARQVIFPLDYWQQIRHHAAARGLDPYLVAALIAQESNFAPDARSPANAYGLMQIVPSTGRQLARKAGIKRFSTKQLTNPAVSIQLGTLHFQQVLRQYGGSAYYALASYNAGESKVNRWIAERGALPQDEFIDDIPYPETQNYVKRILGTAEDYRVLYNE